MYLKRVVANGFKSFADRTEVLMQRGVTCVVGPNGCGKSNIVDAIRWVLGEQSAKALRGGKMQDVIFEGSERRKALPMCEVSLVFADCEDLLGTSFNEVEIKRRVSRDGSSDYYINGKVARLRDIQRLFMDTGVGRDSYSFMAQGQISQIIDANPAGRRYLFEEAAGITRYKSQRKECLSKLGRVDQNLQRVSDVIEEVSRRIGSLKRQASKTLRFKRLKHRLTHIELAWMGREFKLVRDRIREAEHEASTIHREVSTFAEQVAGAEEKLTANKSRRGELYQQLKEEQEALFDRRAEREQAMHQVEMANSRSRDLTERIQVVTQEISELEQQLSEVGTRVADHHEQKESHMQVMGSSDELFAERNASVEEVQSALAKAESELRDTRQSLLMVESSITRLRSNCTTLEVDLKTSETRHEGLSDQVLQQRDELQRASQELETIDKRRKLSEDAIVQAEANVTEAREEADALKRSYKELTKSIQVKDREVAKISAQLTLLQDMQQRFEGFSEGAKAILKGQLDDVLPADERRALAGLLDVDEAYASRLERLLGGASEAIVIQDAARSPSISENLRERKLGQAALQLAGPEGQPRLEAQQVDGLVAANSVVRAVEGSGLDSLVERLLEGCYFADDLEQVVTLWKERPDFVFHWIVTEAGEIFDRRGILLAGAALKGKRKSSLIQRQAEIKKLKETGKKENDLLTELNEQALVLQAQVEEADVRIEERRGEVSEMRQELSGLVSEHRSVTARQRDAEKAVKNTEGELERIEEERKHAEQRLKSAAVELEEGETRLAGLREKVGELEKGVEEHRTERERRVEVLNEARLELAEKRKSLELITRGLSDLESLRQDLNERLGRHRAELERSGEQVDTLNEQGKREQARAEELAAEIEDSQAQLDGRGSEIEQIDKQVTETEKGLVGQRDELHKREKRQHELELKLTKERSSLTYIEEKAVEEYEVDLQECDWKHHLWQAEEEFETRINLDELEDEESRSNPRKKKDRGEPTEDDLKAMDELDWKPIQEEIKQLRARIAAMGEINLVAIEEYAELKERYDFLKQQSDDLWQSKEELLKAIDEINEKSQELFEQTFEQVKKNFQHCFKRLNGGHADLKLLEAEDILESGIEIVAQPIGTKLKTLSLLSGGQKTMTAVSLLFAIYMIKPSPFCVLDELDAPLDDANIGRFTEMLTSFLDNSQFLVITHNKRTLNVANTIYGVTMQEPGCTSLVSLKFNADGRPDLDEPIVASLEAEPVAG